MTQKNENPSNYRPLIVVISMILLASTALGLAKPMSGLMAGMHYFMGLFFVFFAMFKFFDLRGFASGFQMYDLIAKRIRAYAYCYPFFELILGLLYLSGHYPYFTNLLTLILMIISAIGVTKSVKKGMNLKCACLGTALNVPLSTVSIIENIGMGMMAAIMLLF